MFSILIIDDDKETCEFLKKTFEIRKCDVTAATSGAEGLEIIKNHKPSIVLIDYNMPEMNGFETLKKIKEIDHNIKVIVVTVEAKENLEQEYKTYEPFTYDGYIKKPFNVVELEDLIIKNMGK